MPTHLILEMMCESVRLKAHSSPHVCANTCRARSDLAASSVAEAAANASASASALAPGMMLERERCATGVSVLATTCMWGGRGRRGQGMMLERKRCATGVAPPAGRERGGKKGQGPAVTFTTDWEETGVKHRGCKRGVRAAA